MKRGLVVWLLLLVACKHGPAGQDPSAFDSAAALISEAAKIPVKRIPAPDGNIIFSRDEGTRALVADRLSELQSTRMQLESLAMSGDQSSEDASVMLGVLYLVTYAEKTWAGNDAVTTYRTLARCPATLSLSTLTIQRISVSPIVLHALREADEPLPSKIARIFARQLIGHVLVASGREAASHELRNLSGSSQLSPTARGELEAMIQLFDQSTM